MNNALAIAQLEFNARNNAGQGRMAEARNMEQVLRILIGNNAQVNAALARARRIVHQTHERQERARQARSVRSNQARANAQRAALRRVLNKREAARARAARALMAPVLRELNNLRWVPVANFRVKRGRSPSPVRSAKRVRTARAYAGLN